MTAIHVDLAPALSPLLSIASVALTAAATSATAWLYQHWPVLQRIADQRAVNAALLRAGGVAYTTLLQASQGAHVTIHNQAIADGASYLVSSVPAALRRLDVTPDHISAMVVGELGTLLAADPSVTIRQADAVPPAEAPAPPAVPTPQSHETAPAPGVVLAHA